MVEHFPKNPGKRGRSRHHIPPACVTMAIMLYHVIAADLTAHSLALQAAAAAAGISTPQFPFVFNPALLPMATGLPVAEPLNIKTEAPSVQSRGCSPIIMSPSPSLEAADTVTLAAAAGPKQVCESFEN